MTIKNWIIILLLVCGCASTKKSTSRFKSLNYTKEQKYDILVQRADAYYTGCFGGIMAIEDAGYRNDKDRDDPKKSFKILHDHCKMQSIQYYHFIKKAVDE